MLWFVFFKSTLQWKAEWNGGLGGTVQINQERKSLRYLSFFSFFSEFELVSQQSKDLHSSKSSQQELKAFLSHLKGMYNSLANHILVFCKYLYEVYDDCCCLIHKKDYWYKKEQQKGYCSGWLHWTLQKLQGQRNCNAAAHATELPERKAALTIY